MPDANTPYYSVGLRAMNCCGWKEFSTLLYLNSDETKIDFNALLKNAIAEGLMRTDNGNLTCGAILMTEAGAKTHAKYASIVAKMVAERKLGEIVELPSFTNPNTKRKIRSYVWILDQDAIKIYAEKHGLFKLQKVW